MTAHETTSGPARRGTGRRWVLALTLLAVVAVAAGAVAMVAASGGEAGPDASATFAVERGPMTILVSEAGTIQAREQVILKSEVEGQTTIIYLIPEGTHVEKGDLLVELDASALQDKLVDQQIQVQNAEANFIRARENLAVEENQARSDIAQAELDLQFAKEDLVKYQEGEYPKQLKQAESKITLAREELERAEEKLKWSERLFEQKYISQTELESDRLAKNRAELDHELAIADRDLLVQFTYNRTLTELRSNAEQADMALERVRRKAAASVVQAEADLRAKTSEFERQKERLAKLEDQIEKCRIVAPTSGMAIYATTGKGNWRGNEEPLQEGQQVREREELIYLPTASAMMAEVKVHESSLQKVAVGQPVRISIDALPGRTFTGRVSRISPLPDAQSVWLNPDLKVYSTDIVLENTTGEVRTGMTCRADIIVDHFPDTVYVPVHAVLRVGGQPTVYVVRGGQTEPRPIEVGRDNNRMVRVVEGLDPGERVLLSPPLAAGSTTMVFQPEQDEAEGENSAAAMLEKARAQPQANADEQPAMAQATEPDAGETAEAAPAGMDAAAIARRLQDMTPEQREELRKRFESMTPEQREQMRQRFRQGGGGRGERRGGGGGGE